MCQSAIVMITKALPEVDNAERLLRIKNLIALFMQTMDVGTSCLAREQNTNEVSDAGVCGCLFRHVSVEAIRQIRRASEEKI